MGRNSRRKHGCKITDEIGALAGNQQLMQAAGMLVSCKAFVQPEVPGAC